MTDPFDPNAERRFVDGVLAGHPGARAVFEKRIHFVPRMLAALNTRRGRPLAAHDLDDLAQETMLVALRKLPSFRPIAPLEGWLYRLCHYEFLNALRRRGRDRRREQSAGDGLDAVAANPAAEPTSDETLHLAIERLGGIEAEVIRLKHFDGLTLAEIAARLGEPESTVKARYYRARKKLERLLREDPPADEEPS